MTRFTLSFLAVLSGLALPVCAQWKRNFAPIADDAARKSSGDFGAQLFLTQDPQGFWEQWDRPPDPKNPPRIVTADSGCRGDVVMGVVLFSGCKADEEGECRSLVDFKVLRPDGSVYADLPGGELWNRPAMPTGYLQASVGNVAFRVEPDDPFGTYTIQATARDSVAGLALKLEAPFTVKKTGCKAAR